MISEEEKRIQEAVYQAIACIKTCGAHLSLIENLHFLSRLREQLANLKEENRQPPTDLKE